MKCSPACLASDGRSFQPLDFPTPCDCRPPPSTLGACGAACAACPFSDWQPDGSAPLCRESRVLLIERDDDGTLAQLRLGGMNIRPFVQFVARKLKPKKLPLYSQRLYLAIAEHRRDGNTWNEVEIGSELLSVEAGMAYSEILREQRQRFESTLGGAQAEWIDEETGEIRDDDQPFE